MTLYILTKTPKQTVNCAMLEVPATKHDRDLFFQLLGPTSDVTDFFREETTVDRFAILLYANGLESGPQSAVQKLYGDFRSCYQHGEAGNAKLAALFEEAMDKAVERKDGASIGALCASGVDINKEDQFRRTRLSRALASIPLDLDRLRLLCVNGAKLGMVSRQLIRFIRDGNTPVLAVLVENGAIAQKSLDRLLYSVFEAPLHTCVKMLGILLDNGASLSRADGGRNSVIGWAAWRNDTECVKFLLKKGANPDAPLKLRRPLYYAVSNENFEMAGYLSRADASHAGLSPGEQDFVNHAHMSARGEETT